MKTKIIKKYKQFINEVFVPTTIIHPFILHKIWDEAYNEDDDEDFEIEVDNEEDNKKEDNKKENKKEELKDHEILLINNEKDCNKITNNIKKITADNANLTSLPKLPENLIHLSCCNNKLTSLPKLPKSLMQLYCSNNPLEYSIPEKFYKFQDKKWLDDLNKKLSSYEHQKQLIDKYGVNILNKINVNLINDKIKEENPTYFLAVEYGY